jgi:hypothetical protein
VDLALHAQLVVQRAQAFGPVLGPRLHQVIRSATAQAGCLHCGGDRAGGRAQSAANLLSTDPETSTTIGAARSYGLVPISNDISRMRERSPPEFVPGRLRCSPHRRSHGLSRELIK